MDKRNATMKVLIVSALQGAASDFVRRGLQQAVENSRAATPDHRKGGFLKPASTSPKCSVSRHFVPT